MKTQKVTLGLAAVAMCFSLLAAKPAGATDPACWGQASAVFARTGVMGEHASQQETPRIGLRNLARDLYALGLLPDDSLESLGAFVAIEYKLSIDACL